MWNIHPQNPISLGYKSLSKQDQEMRKEHLSLGEGFLECLLPLKFTIQLRWGIQYGTRAQSSAGINLGVHHGPAWGIGLCTYALQLQAGDSGCSHLCSDTPRPTRSHRAGNQHDQEKNSALPPGLSSKLSTPSMVSNSGNGNENNGLIGISGLHGLKDLGKGSACLCGPGGCVRRQFL